MTTCPSCSKTVHSNDLVCAHCGINLHPGTATASPASGGAIALSIVAIVVIAIMGIVLLVGCLGVSLWFFVATPVMGPGPAPVIEPPTDTPSSLPVEPPEEVPDLELPPDRRPAEQAPTQQTTPEEDTATP
jgi:hypothetical protein